MLDALFNSYVGSDVFLEDFVNALTPSNPAFAGNLTSVLITFFFGFLVYVYSLLLVVREKSAPYPVWLHTFYCAADSMGIWVFIAAYRTVPCWFFILGGAGEAVWVLVEIVCLCFAVTTERESIWGKNSTLKHAVLFCLSEILIFFVSLNFLRVELGDVSMFKFWIFTQTLVVCVPGMFWRERGTRIGACWQLSFVLLGVALLSFNPWRNMWALICPEYFGISKNPWFYCMGAVVICFGVYDVYIYAKLPKKPKVLENGKKTIF